MPLTRRKLLGYLPLLGLAGLPGWASAAPVETRYLERLFRNPDAARRLGAACAACGLDALQPLPDPRGLSFRQWQRRLDRQIRADFTEGRMTQVQGLYLSHTEVAAYLKISAATA